MADITSTNNVTLYDESGNQLGTSGAPLRTDPTGATAQPVTDNAGSLTVDNGGTFAVQDSEKVADNAGFTDGTTKVQPAGFIFDETAGTALTENDAAAARIDSKRAQVSVIEDETTRGRRVTVTAANALKVDASGVAVPVTDNSGSLTVDQPTASNLNATVVQGTAAATTAGWPVVHGNVARSSASWTSATSLDTTLSLAVTGYGSIIITSNTTSTFTGGVIIFEASDDAGTTWFAISAVRVNAYTTENSYTLVASTKLAWEVDVAGFTNFRVRLNPAISGTGTLTIALLANAGSSDPCPVVGQSVASNLNAQVVGEVAHGATNSGNPVQVGNEAIAHGSNPSAVTAGQRTKLYANRAGIPFFMGGHPNVVCIRANYTGAQTDTAIVTVSSGTKIVVTRVTVTADNANTVNTQVRIGFATATTPTTTGVVATHPGIPAGGGFTIGDGSGILGIGADNEDLRITSGAPTTGSIDVCVSYYTIES